MYGSNSQLNYIWKLLLKSVWNEPHCATYTFNRVAHTLVVVTVNAYRYGDMGDANYLRGIDCC